MIDMNHSKALSEVEEYIYSKMDLSCVLNRMIDKEGWLKGDAEKALEMYKNFLLISRKYGSKDIFFIPTIDIDEIWHNHILCTKTYTKDMNAIFGRYFHHVPDEEAEHLELKYDSANSFQKTAEFYKKEFGTDYENIRFRPTVRFFIKIYLGIKNFFTKTKLNPRLSHNHE